MNIISYNKGKIKGQFEKINESKELMNQNQFNYII